MSNAGNASTPCGFRPKIERYLTGASHALDPSQIESHLDACAACRQFIDAESARTGIAWGIEISRAAASARGAVRAADAGTALDSHRIEPPAAEASWQLPTVVGRQATEQTTHSGRREAARQSAGDVQWRALLAPAQADDEIGRLANYRLLEQIGSGGMGVVFRAQDLLLDRQVAIKLIHPLHSQDAESRQRFLREARLAAAIESPHVVPIHQAGEDRGVLFLTMPLLRGQSLEERLQTTERLPLAEVLRIARETALALAAAHDRGLIHRDIKPANIYLCHEHPALSDRSNDADSSAPLAGTVRVLDFGLARLLDDQAGLTQTAALVGTPAYMAPEQALGEELNPQADLFSLGCVLYRMLAGRNAFAGKTVAHTLSAVLECRPPRLENLAPEAPRALIELVNELLQKTPAARPATAHAVLHRIIELETGAAPLASRQRRTAIEGRRRSWLIWIVPGVAAAFVIALATSGWQVVTRQGGRPVSPLDNSAGMRSMEGTQQAASTSAETEPTPAAEAGDAAPRQEAPLAAGLYRASADDLHESKTQFPAWRGAGVYALDPSPDDEFLQREIAALNRQSRQQYCVVTMQSFGDYATRMSEYAKRLAGRFKEQAVESRLPFETQRFVLIVLARRDQQLITEFGDDLVELGLAGPPVTNELLVPHFLPQARQGKVNEGVVDLARAIEKWIAGHEPHRHSP